ncbi:hypothetical protein PTMSG1_03087 [Pyrenophora teres f. maculata]|nr:hypothetical protein PTMSG1_03087 [Pyrenophora teres f. maculata]
MTTGLAEYLVREGVGPEILVPLCFEKSMWTVVAMLAVLKAGGAFVPIDPAQPRRRIEHIFERTEARIVLTSRLYLDLAQGCGRKVVVVDQTLMGSVVPGTGQAIPIGKTTSSAYVMFTSGSTGEPKGVVIEHSAASTSCLAHGKMMNLGRGTRALQFSAHTFDFSLMEIFTTLMYSGCVCIPSDHDRTNNLADAIMQFNVNMALLTPTVANLLEPDSVPSLRLLVLGGEAVEEKDVARWGGSVSVMNGYGPTECCILSNMHTIVPGYSTAQTIGTAVGSVSWVVDPNDHNKLVPIGVPGELLIEGPILARGYLNDLKKTSDAFVDNPAWLLCGAADWPGRQGRLYKTGDLVRYNPDGTLYFIGRKDSQVKVRGQRVELGEIEHHVRECIPMAQQIIVEVVVLADENSKTLLAAFLQLNDKGRSTLVDTVSDRNNDAAAQAHIVFPAEANEELAKRLPGYMMPSIYIAVGEMPVTASGKTDRRRLREIGASFSAQQLAKMQTLAQGQKRQPSTVAERTMQQLWAQVLNIEPTNIGLDDSFLRLGGDSIAAIKLVGEARRAGIQFSVADLFRASKLAEFAKLERSSTHGIEDDVSAFSLLREDADAAQVREEVALSCGIKEGLIEDIYPCSPLQEGMVALTSKRSGNYITQAVLDLRMDIANNAFRAAWEDVVHSTATLRTRVVQHHKLGLLQAVVTEEILWLESGESLDEYLQKDRSISMDLGDPLTRYALVKEAHTGKCWMVWTIHHALYDAWSFTQIINAVIHAYTGGRVEKQTGFHSFIKYLSQQDQDSAATYWKTTLANCEATIFPSLPLAVQQPVADLTVTLQCPPFPKATLGTTTSTLVRAAWSILTSRYTNSDDVVFGTTVTGRNAPIVGIEAIPGPTIATVPVRVRVQGNQTVSDFLEALQQQATDMITYEQTGLQRIANPAKNMFGNGDVLGEWRDRSELQSFSTYALTVQCMLADDGVQILASFDQRVVENWLVEKMLSQFSFILQQLASAPAQTAISSIEIMTPEDRQQLWAWNKDVPPAVDRCIHDLFAGQALARPNAPAIDAWDGEMTYSELDTLSTRLSSHLVELGVQPEDILPLCFEKSMWTVVAMLAVLKAGGAFLLLDPALPPERLKLMCSRVSATLALASRASAAIVQDLVRAVVVITRDSILQISQRVSWTPSVRPENTAYVIFTSGSTGEPKGCRIEHQASCSAVVRHGHQVNIQTNTRTLQFGSYSFAGSLAEIILTLSYGGCICIPTEEDRRTRLALAVSKMKVNWAFLTSTVLETLIPQEVPSLTTLCVGGEPMNAPQITQWENQVHLRQTYGSSETSGFVSSTQLTRTSTTRDVGWASTGVYWIVDPNDHNRLLPAGVVGEVLIEGPILGREYIGAPDKTAATFINTPAWRCSFGPSTSLPRLYKTGDLARFKKDGSLELLGRKDSQVKLRGQRIELGEIEHQARMAEADIKELAVELVRPRIKQGNMLACFVVINDYGEHSMPKAHTQSAIRAIQDRLEQLLPQYMVPTVFVPIAHLPMTWSRKIDRKRLREIGASFSAQQLAEMRTLSQGSKRQPETETERVMQQLWARVLGIEPDNIGLDDSFFRLGGDSITAMKLVGDARKAGVQLSVADVFRYPKLAVLASSNFSLDSRNSSNDVIPAFSLLGEDVDTTQIPRDIAVSCGIDAGLVEDVYPCSPLQEGMMALSLKRSGGYVMQTVLELRADIDEAAFRAAWEQVVRSTATLRTRIVQHRKLGLLQAVVTEEIQWLEKSGENVEEYLQKDKLVTMKLGDQLARYALVKEVHTGKRWMIWTIHHALYDGWSLPKILDAVTKTYQGSEVENPPGFHAFIKYLGQQDQDAAATYWQPAFAECQATPFPSLPSAVQQPVVDMTMTYQCPPLPRGTSEMTTSTFIRAAWAILASRYTNSDDVIFGATVMGRNAPIVGIETMTGPTIATVPVRVRVQGNQTVSDFLEALQQQATDMIAYEQTGLQQIAKMTTGARHACDFQTLLIVQPVSTYQNNTRDNLLGEWRSHSELHDFTTYALTIECTLATEGVQILASFDQRVVEDWLVKNMLRQFSFILQQLASAPAQAAISSIEIMTPEDRQQLWAWNKDVPPAVDRCIHDLFTEQALIRPNAPAICAWDGDITYSELDTLSTRLSGRLVELGIKPEDVVPLCFEKSMWTVVAMLAVLKAGGAFLLLDPTLPSERLKLMCSKVSATLALASQASAAVVQDLVRAVVIVTRDSIESTPITPIAPSVRATHTAFVIFTSGSTGEPKGCSVEHSAACSALVGNGQRLGIKANTRSLQFSSFSFAASLFEIQVTLVSGGCVCIPTEEQRRTDLSSVITSMSINWTFLTPTTLDSLSSSLVPSLITVCVGGEPIRPSQIIRWEARVHLRQTYGSSETGLVSSTRLTRKSAPKDVGKAYTGVYWIVDPNDHNRLLPAGVVGEVLIEGPILGREYIGAPDKTAATFINTPAWRCSFGPSTSLPRLYKTGDLARFKKDGSLELLGRKDSQVKLRGQRIELGEIEHQARLAEADIKELAVELIKGENQNSMLACFVAINESGEDSMPILRTQDAIRTIQDRLERILPQYMVPTVFVPIAHLPLTWSKKVDRKRLREIGASFTVQQLAEMRTLSQGLKRQPETEAEKMMQQLWARVLGVEQDSIGTDDSFFRLGGDSIAAMKLVGDARKAGIQLSVADLFRHPKLATLASIQGIRDSSPVEEVGAFFLLDEDVDVAQVREETAAICSVDASLIEDIYPCSPLQEGLMSLTAKRAGDYVMQSVLSLRADVNEDAFRAAWQHIVRSTAALRTRMVQHSELGLLQVVVEEEIQWIEAEGVEEYVQKDKSAWMGLGDQLTRYAFIKEPHGGRRWFVWTIHHALYDSWSLPQILHAVDQAYEGTLLERPPNFNAFIQYIGQQDQEAAAAYWQRTLADCDAAQFPPLPSTVTQPVTDTIVTYQCPLTPKGTSDTTTSTLIRAAWAMLVSRYTNSDDVVFGATVTGRNAPVKSIEAMIGLTIATVPVRVCVRSEQTVLVFLEALQQQATDMITHEQTGLQRIAKLGLGARHACGFQTLLVVQSGGDMSSSTNNMLGEWHSRSEVQNFTTYALTIECTLAAKGVQIAASFDGRVVEDWLVKKMLSQFSFVMQQLAEVSAEEKVADINIITPEDMQQLWAWNQTVPTATDRCVHDLFAEQARARPDALAVCAWDGEMTYSELDTLSSKVAGHLVQLSLKSEDIVPLCFEKSMWTVVAMLAVLKAGGAFVPLDPSHPTIRHEDIFRQTGTRIVLASAQYSSRWSSSSYHTVTVSEASTSQLPEVDDTSSPRARPTDAAYIMFTSGSTGMPKGAVIEHKAVVTSCLGHGQAFGITNVSRVLQFTAYTFDVCIAEIITTLIHGGCICVPSDSERRDNLAKAITDMQVNLGYLTSSVARLLDPCLVPSLKVLVLGGEQVNSTDWDKWPSSVQTINGYGPTECCIFCTGYTSIQGFHSGNIGTSIASVSWVVDPENHHKLAPLGSIGELLVEGPILARGYLDDIEKTNAAFVNNPNWLLQGSKTCPGRKGRLYKTGDLVRYDSHGNLICLGRKDSQVKLHGQRIELGEIEHHVLECLPEARQMSVEMILPSGERSHMMLAAFIRLEGNMRGQQLPGKAIENGCTTQIVFLEDLKQEVAKRLPEHMVPTVFFGLSQFPVTTSGKTDRKRLREIGASFTAQQLAEMRTLSQGSKRQPETETERVMQQLWARVLGIEPDNIGLDDSFFRLGGDSITAMKLVGDARKAGVQLSVAGLFRQPNLAALASSNFSLDSRNSSNDVIPAFSLLGEDVDTTQILRDIVVSCGIDAGLVEDVYPCSPLQEGMMALSLKRSGDYIMQTVLELRADIDEAAFRAAWEHVVRSTPILRTRIVQNSKLGLLQVVTSETTLWAEAETLEDYAEQDKLNSMGLGDTLSRYAIVKDRYRAKKWFVWTAHHALYDGWSLPRLMDAVQNAYKGSQVGYQPGFHSFIRYLVQQDKKATSAYWRAALAGCEAMAFPPLPPDVQHPLADTVVEIMCPPPPASARSDITVSTLIRAAWAIVVARHTNSDDVVFGAVVLGRNAPIDGIEDIVGPTVATVPIRVRIVGNQTVPYFLAAVQQQATEMIAYEQTGLQYIAKISADAQVACDFQTLLVVQPRNTKVEEEEGLGKWYSISEIGNFTPYGLTLECALADNGVCVTAKFDPQAIESWHVQKMLGQFRLVLEQLSQAGLEVEVASIEVLPPQDRQELERWNSEVPPAIERCVHDLFSDQAKAQPDAPAICAWDGKMTYKELAEESQRLASYLVKLGVGPEVLVPLCFEKSMWTIVAMLAVLKAGGAFVPLDPEHPKSRHEDIIKQTNANVVLTSTLHSDLWIGSSLCVVAVSEGSLSQLSDELPKYLPTTNASSAAYIIFTSGSTGVPKGVVLEHSAVSTSCIGQGEAFGFGLNTRCLQFAAYTFDVCLEETITTLFAGGCVCVPSESDRRSDLAGAINSMGVNSAILTPSITRIIDPNAVLCLETLIFTGEQVYADEWKRWETSSRRLRNGYGPTECAMICNSYRDQDGSKSGFKSGLIGRAVASVSWVVDPNNHNRLAPLGSIGELVVEGPILARGYLHDAEKTRASFISNPAWMTKRDNNRTGRQGRVYKTGDLVRYESDGGLICIGRKDSQVKVRGQRVELGEIEHHVRDCMSTIQQTVVEAVTLAGQDSKMMLVAFLQLSNEGRSALKGAESHNDAAAVAHVALPAEASAKLAQQLPGYMMPSIYFAVQEMPMTVSGKTDRKRLREIAGSFSFQQLVEMQTLAQGQKRQPWTEAERTMQQLWARALNIDPGSIGLDDSFFQLGGDSIAAIKLVGEARTAGINLTVADLFRCPTLAAFNDVDKDHLEDVSTDNTPFSLLDPSVDIAQVCEEAARSTNVDAHLIENIYPCSPLQEGLISLTAKRAGEYVMRKVLELRADIDQDAFQAAWEQVIRSTAILRTRIVQNSKLGLLQVVTAEPTKWAEAESLDEYMDQDMSTSMGLGDTLSRYAIVKERYRAKKWFVWTAHHALYDGWSLPRLMDAVRNAYNGGQLGQEPGFHSFIKYLGQQDQEATLAYWRAALAGCEAMAFPPLPSDVRSPSADATIEVVCPPLAKACSNITTWTLIRAAWAIVAARHTNADDVVFGTVLTGRNASVTGIEAVIGPTVATVPMRVRIVGNQTVPSFLATLQHQATEMIPYEQTGLQHIAKISADARRACDFQTLLVVRPRNTGLEEEEWLGKWHDHSKIDNFITYSLTIEFTTGAEGIRVVAIFDTRAIESWQVEKMLDMFMAVLKQLAKAGPETEVANIDLLTHGDRKELERWNGEVPPAVQRCVHDLFSDQVKARPDAPAICAWDGELTYQELDMLSTRLAGHFVYLGVKSEDIVPLCFEKSMWTIVAMLAVLKAGGAFVPLDPEHPKSRHEEIFKQTNAQVVVTSTLHSCLWTGLDLSTVIVSEELLAQLSSTLLPALPTVNPSSAVYIIFTSGSTGVPKGVVLEHSAVSTSCIGQGEAFGFGLNTRCLQFAAYTFDVCLEETITTLFAGGCVCVPSESDRRSDLAGAINSEQVYADEWKRWETSSRRLRNGYGPTECAMICNSYRDQDGKSDFKSGLIGRAVASVSWVVDPNNHNRLAPLGSIGELVVEGPILARGYLNDAEKTKASFFGNPAWLVEGAGRQGRVYKTGDLVQYEPDGGLVYIGRKDGQVKVRGQRVELGEIEYHVRECMPMAHEIAIEMVTLAGDGRKTVLAAFLQLGNNKGRSTLMGAPSDSNSAAAQAQIVFPAEANAELLQRLPGYMMPSIYFAVQDIPITVSGKTDRRRLRDIGGSFSAQQLAEMQTLVQSQKRQPSTEAERTMQQLWAQVLNIEPVSIGLDDSFFQLGGDSIAAMKLVVEARTAGINLSVADLFLHPTLDTLPATFGIPEPIRRDIPPFGLLPSSMQEAISSTRHVFEPYVKNDHIADVLPLTNFQEECISVAYQYPYLAFNYLSIHLGSQMDIKLLKMACRSLLEHFPILRSRFLPYNGQFWQVVYHSLDLPFHTYNIDTALQEACDSICAQDCQQRPASDVPIQFMFVQHSSMETRLIIRISHAQYDGYSMPLIFQALSSAYSQKPLNPCFKFSNFLAYSNDRREASTLYWQRLLAGSYPTRIAPMICPTGEREAVPQKLVAEGIISLPMRLGSSTVASLISSAWAIVLSYINGEDDVVFWRLVAGRNSPDPDVAKSDSVNTSPYDL